MLISCPNCEFSREIDDTEVPEWAKAVKCPQCGQPFSIGPEPSLEWLPETPKQPAPLAKTELWDIPLESKQGGFFRNFWLTINMVLFRPGAYFNKMRPDGGYEMPIAFVVVLSFICAVLGTAVMFAIRAGVNETLGDATDLAVRYLGPAPTPGRLFINLIILPLLMPVYMFIHAAIMDNFLPTVKAKNLGFESTYRVASYGMAPNIFNAVPFLGNLIALVWGGVVTIIGLSRVYQTSPGSVALAALFPYFLYLLVFGCIFLLPFLF